MGVVQVGEQKAPLVQANFLAAIPLLKKLFVKQPPQTVKVPEPTPQPEWFNVGAAGMQFTFYDENNTPLYSETMAVGNISPAAWGRLVQKYDITQNGTIEVELFNYNTTPAYFDEWHIELTENSKPEIVQEVHYDPWGLVMEDESYFAPVSPANGADLFNGKELQTFADLNFYDYHWRQYDPQLGRWHSPDPADQFYGISGYAYCANNPVMLTDPDGRAIPLLVFVGAAIVGGGLNVWNNKEKIRDVWSGLAYFGVGAAGGAMAVVNPKAGFAIASLGNVGVDIATGNVPTFEKWQDVAGYGFSTGLNALDVVAVGQFTKVAYQAIKTWKTVTLGTKTIGSGQIITGAVDRAAFSAVAPTFEVTFSKVPSLFQLLPVNQVVKQTPKLLKFGQEKLMMEHFGKHASEIMKALGKKAYNLKDYMDDANYVVREGMYVPEINAYIKYVGGGSPKFALTGLDRVTGNITTFHIKSLKELLHKAPSLKNIYGL